MNTQQVTGTAKEVEGKAEKTYGNAKEQIGQMIDKAVSQGQKRANEMGSLVERSQVYIRRNPGKSLGVGLATGVVLGAVIAILARD